jgi:hypothetical protein
MYTVEAYTLSVSDLITTCDASTAPTNGDLGTCTSSLALGAACMPTCNSGYILETPTSCSASGILTTGTCQSLPAWVSRNSMPTARYQLAVATTGNLIYTLGGLPYLTTLEVYTPTTDLWSTKTPMPNGRSLMSAAAITGRLYVAGGGWPSAFLNLQLYNAATDAWTSRKPMPDNNYMPNYKYGWDVWGDRMHVVGGYDGRPSMCFLPANCRSVVHLSYTGSTDAWTSLRSMPTQREDHGAAVVGSNLFAVGGTSPSQAVLAIAEKYTHSTDTWTTIKAIPSARYMLAGSAVRAMGNRLVAIGGFWPGIGYESDIFEMYTPSTDSWATQTPMPTRRDWHGLAIIGSRIYDIGGSNYPETSSYDALELWVDTTSYAAITISQMSPTNIASTFTGAVSIRGINFASLDQTPTSYASGAITR